MEDEMDYRIYYLDIVPNTQEIIDYLKHLHEVNDGSTDLERESAEGWFVPYLVMAEYTDIHWPNHENVMKEISSRFPDVIFELESWGHKFGDIFKKVFKDGDMEMFEGFIEYKRSDLVEG